MVLLKKLLKYKNGSPGLDRKQFDFKSRNLK